MEVVLQSLNQKLQEAIAEKPDHNVKQHYLEFLNNICDGKTVTTKCPDFSNELQWINTSEPLNFTSSLKGKVVVLDFWTYCCINCMHILPDLHALEQKYSVKDGVVIIGVHSAKFPNEKDSTNIENAIRRYGIEHAVVNDSNASMWHQLGIQCWPTVVVVSPNGELLNQFIGEGHRNEMMEFIGCTLEAYKSSISNHPLPLSSGKMANVSYPTKLLAADDYILVSDAGRHKVVIMSVDGHSIKEEIGSGQSGHRDGSIFECQFISPQGMCKVEDTVYVVDSDTHHLRKICLTTKQVTTLCGTGELGNDKIGGKSGLNQILSSPWDVKKYCSKHPQSAEIADADVDMLLIAMAGTHQIWAYFLKDSSWWKNQTYTAGTCVAIVGSGREENRNNSYPMKCGLAQPSGLSIDYVNSLCYIADSESSTIRQLDLKTGQVKGVVGGGRDPMNLFEYGDADGKGVEVKLQHPLDVCYIPETNFVIVCDSYNHKLKLLKVAAKIPQSTVTTINIPNLDMNEPGGLSYHSPSRSLYIADTNKHCVRRIHLPADISENMILSEPDLVPMTSSRDETDSSEALFNPNHKSVQKSEKQPIVLGDSDMSITIMERLPDSTHLTPDMDSYFRCTFMAADSPLYKPSKGQLRASASDATSVIMDIPLDGISSDIRCRLDKLVIESVTYYCSDSDNVCKRQNLLISQPVVSKNPSAD